MKFIFGFYFALQHYVRESSYFISEFSWQIWRDGEVRLEIPFIYFENE